MTDFFRRIGILHSINATHSIDQVFKDIQTSLGLPETHRPLNSRTLNLESPAALEKP